MTDLIIRPYEPRDADAVWSLHNVALAAAGAYAGNGPWDADLRTIPETYGAGFLVGFAGDELVAMGAFKRTGLDEAEVKRMRVAPVWQRHGFGRILLAAIEDAARAAGCRRLHLDTTTDQIAAQKFYAALGYRKIHEERRGRFDFIFYEKQF
jgi:GNAT superfamily N-acetyltransferase